MPEMLMTRLGMAMVPANAEAEEKIARIPERRQLKTRISIPRNPKTHRLLFAVLKDICPDWPENTDPNPDGNTEKLRAYLLIRVGWCEWDDYPLSDKPKLRQMTIASVSHQMDRMLYRGEHAFLREGKIEGVPALRMYVAKSINHEKIGEDVFAPIEQAVFDEIEVLTGIKVQDVIDRYHAGESQAA